MEFGFSLPSRGQAATMQNMRLLAQHVEADCGVSHMVFDIMTTDVAEMQRVMERFAHDVKGGVRI